MSVITEYINSQPADKREQLLRIHHIVHDEISDIEDGWKYGIATYLYRSKPILGFATTKVGISIYPYGNDTIMPFLSKEITPYITGGGTLSFKEGVSIPDDLVQKIVHVRKDYVDQIVAK